MANKTEVKFKVVGGKHHMVIDGVVTTFEPGDEITIDPADIAPGLEDRLVRMDTEDSKPAQEEESASKEEAPDPEPEAPAEEEPEEKPKKKGGK